MRAQHLLEVVRKRLVPRKTVPERRAAAEHDDPRFARSLCGDPRAAVAPDVHGAEILDAVMQIHVDQQHAAGRDDDGEQHGGDGEEPSPGRGESAGDFLAVVFEP